MKSSEKLIHDTLTTIDWNYVLYTYKTLDLPLNGSKKVTKKQLLVDLRELLTDVFKLQKNYVHANNWIISFYKDNDDIVLEVSFAPITIYTDSFGDMGKKRQIDDLKNQLEIATQAENYERAVKIKKTLDKLYLEIE